MEFMKRAVAPLALCIAMTLFLIGCASKGVTPDYDPEYPIGSLKTFVVEPGSVQGDALDRGRIESAISHTLRQKGYRVEFGHDADFTVIYELKIEKEVPSPLSFGFGLGTFGSHIGASIGTRITPRHDEAILSVRMVDPRHGRVFWSARARETLDMRTKAGPRAREIFWQNMVDRILGRFPATKAFR